MRDSLSLLYGRKCIFAYTLVLAVRCVVRVLCTFFLLLFLLSLLLLLCVYHVLSFCHRSLFVCRYLLLLSKAVIFTFITARMYASRKTRVCCVDSRCAMHISGSIVMCAMSLDASSCICNE